MYHKRALRREETLSLEMYHFQPPKNSSWHLHHLPLGAKTHLRKAISTAHSQLDGSTLDHFLYNLRKHGFQFVFARYLQRHLCIHIKKHVFLIVHNTSTPTKKTNISYFQHCSNLPLHLIFPQKERRELSTTAASLGSVSTAMLPTTNQQAAALGRDGAARFVKLQKVTQKMAGLGRNVGRGPALYSQGTRPSFRVKDL